MMKLYATSVSHNVRSPIHSISMLAFILLKKLDKADKEILKIIEAIYSASRLSNFLIQDLLDNNEQTEANEKMETLKQRISNETITPKRQKNSGRHFFRALGRGCPWGTKSHYHNDSIDARLLGCACCGMKEYDDIDQFEIKKQFHFLS